MKNSNSIHTVLAFTVFLNACNTKKQEAKVIDAVKPTHFINE